MELYNSNDRGSPSSVVLDEIEYSNNQQTFTRGLEELLKYIEFAQKGSYLSDRDVDVHGLLITDDVEVNEVTPLDGRVTHISAGSLLLGDSPTGWVPEEIQ